MKKSDVIVADITLYAMKQIQMAKFDRKVSGDIEYWNGEIMSMKYLLLYIDRLMGKKNKNDTDFPDLKDVFNRIDDKRKENFDVLWSRIWEDDIEE